MPDAHRSGDADAAMREKPVVVIASAARRSAEDAVAREEPLEIQVQGASVAVLMRTPGDDLDLALGYLLTEGIIRGRADVASMRHCSSVKDPDAEENILRVVLAAGVELSPSAVRQGFASSSCGVCGKATIESTLVAAPPITSDASIAVETLYTLPDRLREGQRAFEATGGLHAAGLFTLTGERLVVREDVGRHNAVDKTIGASLALGLDRARTCLLVSGRISFEIVQKAAVAGIPIVAGISAPTSLAVELGERAGVAVAGFLRGRSVNVYSCPSRLGS
jgi:FdhD protein